VNLIYDFSLKTDKKLLGATKREKRGELGNEHKQNLATEQNCDSTADNISDRCCSSQL